MNTQKKLFLSLVAGALMLAGCEEIHDPVDDLARTGNFAANVYMELGSGDVTAGNTVDFYAEYWSIDNEYQSLSLLYGVEENLNYSLSVPEMSYTWTLDSARQVREAVEMLSFEHSESNYDPDKRSNVVSGNFEVSYLLAPVEVKNPINYNAGLVSRLFSPEVMEQFYRELHDHLYNKMVNDTLEYQVEYDFLHDMLVDEEEGLTQEEFDGYFEFVEKVVDGEPVTLPVVLESTASELINRLRDVPLDLLTYNSNDQNYAVNYYKGYVLNCLFKVVNGNNIANYSDEKMVKVL